MSVLIEKLPTEEGRLKVIQSSLEPEVRRIDREGFYPEAFLRQFGAVGGFSAHAHEESGITESLQTIARVGAVCGSTAFLLWCQDACVWYLRQTENIPLQERYLDPVSRGAILGGTALSNPLKHDAGLEDLKLRGVRVRGGYRVTGTLPWVSNLGVGHLFGTLFETSNGRVAALVPVDGEEVRLAPSGHFAALDGTATYAVRFDNTFIPEENLLAEDAAAFLRKIRPGFLLLQVGIGLGIIQGALNDIQKANRRLREINEFLPYSYNTIAEELAPLQEEAAVLGSNPFAETSEELARVLRLRLATALLVEKATLSSLYHAGAPGFLVDSAPQRRVREGLFFSLLTPSTKHLRQLLLKLRSQ